MPIVLGLLVLHVAERDLHAVVPPIVHIRLGLTATSSRIHLSGFVPQAAWVGELGRSSSENYCCEFFVVFVPEGFQQEAVTFAASCGSTVDDDISS